MKRLNLKLKTRLLNSNIMAFINVCVLTNKIFEDLREAVWTIWPTTLKLILKPEFKNVGTIYPVMTGKWCIDGKSYVCHPLTSSRAAYRDLCSLPKHSCLNDWEQDHALNKLVITYLHDHIVLGHNKTNWTEIFAKLKFNLCLLGTVQ